METTGYKRLINCIVPVTACNLKCHYCYIGQMNDFHGEIKPLPYSVADIAYALRPERMGCYCNMNLCALGETLLAPYIVQLAEKLAQDGHFVTLVTNGLLNRKIEEICALSSDVQSHIFFKFSFHYLELKSKNLIDAFFNNILIVRNSNCSFTVELTVNDESIPYIEEIQNLCLKRLGAACHVIESRNQTTDGLIRLTRLPVGEHLDAWRPFDSDLFAFQETTYEMKRHEFCYAGDWVLSFYLESGNILTCFGGGNLLGNLYVSPDEPFHAAAVGSNCPWPHCYPSYAVMTSGAIPSLSTPCYAQMRNRVCLDKSEWLKPAVKDFFSMQFRDSNTEYSPLKKAYLNALMSLEYKNPHKRDFTINGDELKSTLIRQGWKTLAIYGRGEREEFLLETLKRAGVRVLFTVDSDFQLGPMTVSFSSRIKQAVKYRIKRLLSMRQAVLLNRYDRWPRVDAVIVLDYPIFDRIKHTLPPKKAERLIPLTELVQQ